MCFDKPAQNCDHFSESIVKFYYEDADFLCRNILT